MTTLDPIRQGDVGTVIELVIQEDGVAVDLTTATAATMTFRKPDGTDLAKTASIVAGTGGQIRYTLISGDIDQPGHWPLQGRVTFPNGAWATVEARLEVERRL